MTTKLTTEAYSLLLRRLPGFPDRLHDVRINRRLDDRLEIVKQFAALLADGKADYFDLFEDFVGGDDTALPQAWAQDLQTANLVAGYDSAHGGVYGITTSSDSEAQAGQLTAGDNLYIDLSKNPLVAMRVKINFATLPWSADQRAVWGVSSAHATAETSLDGTTLNAWFRIEGASANIYAEVDDNTTNTDDSDTGVDIADDTWATYAIDFADLANVKFFIDGVLVKTLAMSAIVAGNVVQPIVCIQRDAGTEVEAIKIDWFAVFSDR